MSAELLELARTVAIEAGELAARRLAEGVEVAATKSTVVDVVTEADREVERLIRDRIAAARPRDGILGEEGGAERGESGLTWVVDPIDGTVNYLYGIPHYAVSIAVVEGEPHPRDWSEVAACVVNPATGEVYTASRGGGARLGNRALRVPEPPPLHLALVGTGFAYASETRAKQGGLLAELLPLVRDIRRLGTASLDLCFVAAGRFDVYFERTLSPWDHAAGGLIAKEAGALVTGWDGAAPGRDFLLAAHPEMAARFAVVLADLGIGAQLGDPNLGE